MFRSEAGGAQAAGEGAWLNPLTRNDNEVAYRNNSHWIVPATEPSTSSSSSSSSNNGAALQEFFTCEETGELFETHSPNRLLDVPGPSNHVAYFDAASLYPSSGEPFSRSQYQTHTRALLTHARVTLPRASNSFPGVRHRAPRRTYDIETRSFARFAVPPHAFPLALKSSTHTHARAQYPCARVCVSRASN